MACRPSKLVIMFIAAAGGLWLLATTLPPFMSSYGVLEMHTSEPTNTSDVSLEHASKYPLDPATLQQLIDSFTAPIDNVARKQVVVRTVPVNGGGLGSVVAQLRSSAAIATMLGASLSTFGVMSDHITRYKAASLLHIDLLDTPLDVGTTICSLSASPSLARTVELVTTWCDNVTSGEEQALELQSLWNGCGLILDDRPWDAHYDMSKCTWKWVKHVFSQLGLKKRTGGIGLHIRWGDMSLNSYSSSVDPMRPERSTPIDKAAELLRKMRECGMQDELSVYMEWHNTTILSGLGEPYRIVDSGDSIDDLLDLAANRVMILDISSWTVLAHQIADAEGGITIIPDIDLFDINWYDNGVNHVLRWNELLSIPCSDLSTLLGS
jgi:hypothetical protein